MKPSTVKMPANLERRHEAPGLVFDPDFPA